MATRSKAGFYFVSYLIVGCGFTAEESVRTGPAADLGPTLPTSVAAKAASALPPNVIATLRFRDVDLVITRAETGQRFTVKGRSGMSLATDVEEADLRKHHPDLYSAYRFGYARGVVLDARLDLPRQGQHPLRESPYLPRESHRSPDGL
jgi:hypothetical protein